MQYLDVKLTPFEHKRLFNKIKINEETKCWDWIGGKDSSGYGQGFINHRREKVHRIIYSAFKGRLPRGLGKHIPQVDHLCRNKLCCNPDHLELVPPRINNLRSNGITAINAKKTLCKYGHEFYLAPNGRRVCKMCDSAAKKRRKLGPKSEYWKAKSREAAKRWYNKHKKKN